MHGGNKEVKCQLWGCIDIEVGFPESLKTFKKLDKILQGLLVKVFGSWLLFVNYCLIFFFVNFFFLQDFCKFSFL